MKRPPAICLAALLLAPAVAVAGTDDRQVREGGTLAGRVIAKSGAVTNAIVRATRLDPELGALSYSKVRTIRTDVGGAFRLRGLVFGSYLLDARDEERWLPFPLRVTLTSDQPDLVGLSLIMEEASAIQGVVRDSSGRPVAGVLVSVGDGGYQAPGFEPVPVFDHGSTRLIHMHRGFTYPRLPLATTVTDDSGRFRLAPVLPDRETSIRLGGRPPYHDKTVAGLVPGRGEPLLLEVELDRGATIRGRAIQVNGEAAAEARVSLHVLEGGPTPEAAWTVLTRRVRPDGAAQAATVIESTRHVVAGDGAFEFTQLLEGRYVLVAESDHWARTISPVVIVTAPDQTYRIDLALNERRELRGMILDGERGPIRAGSVEVVGEDSMPRFLSRLVGPVRVPIHGDGTFRIDRFGARTLDLRIHRTGSPPVLVEAVPTGNGPVAVQLQQ